MMHVLSIDRRVGIQEPRPLPWEDPLSEGEQEATSRITVKDVNHGGETECVAIVFGKMEDFGLNREVVYDTTGFFLLHISAEVSFPIKEQLSMRKMNVLFP